MVTVAIRELRNNTAKVIQRVRDGETVVLASHGEPMAQVVPLVNAKRAYLTPDEVMAIPKADVRLREDLAALDDDTDTLGPIQ